MDKYRIAIFIHAALLDRCKERVLQILNTIHDSGLMEYTDNIFINFIGTNMFELEEYKRKIKTLRLSYNLSDYELPTLQYLYDFAKNNIDYKILYLHTKNVGKSINLCIEDQVNYMLYFNVTKWKECVENLDSHDTVGVDLRIEPTLHYSGNFWWGNASYIKTLPEPILFNIKDYPNPLNSARHNQEFWICYNKGKHKSLWDCGINCYERHLHRYNKKLYVR